MPASSIQDYDDMVELEGVIMEALAGVGDVDGHDAGSGEMNIFILTDEPHLALDRIKLVLGTRDFMPDLKVAYRKIEGNQFTIIHPPDLTYFAIA